MNNTINFYRVEHSDIQFRNSSFYVGPYVYFKNIASTSENQKWGELCGKHEPGNTIYKKFNINNWKLKMIPSLSNERRPGPFEDIELRSRMLNFMGGFTKNSKFHLYGFASLMQYYSWFNDPDELSFLNDYKFVLRNYLVKTQDFLYGNTQCVINPYGIKSCKNTIKLSDLNSTMCIDVKKLIKI